MIRDGMVMADEDTLGLETRTQPDCSGRKDIC